jgi:hypothetical protein
MTTSIADGGFAAACTHQDRIGNARFSHVRHEAASGSTLNSALLNSREAPVRGSGGLAGGGLHGASGRLGHAPQVQRRYTTLHTDRAPMQTRRLNCQPIPLLATLHLL